MPTPVKKTRKSRWLRRLNIALPILATAVAAAQAVLPELREVMSPWAYAGASIVIASAVSGLTRASAEAANDV